MSEITFEALPPVRGRGFAQSWWGQTWMKALEDSVLEHDLLVKGRKQARAGAVGAVSVRPGRITAVVLGRDRTPYRSDVLLQELDEADWERLLDIVADRAGHIAALLEHDMPPHLVEDASAAGVELLPGIGDLQAECTCEEWDHCEHTAALCYHVARLLDQDPFILLLMRGRGEAELLDELQARSASRATRAAEAPQPAEPEGVLAEAAFASRQALPALPPPPPPVAEPGSAPALAGDTEPAPGLDAAALEFLIEDTAVRARRLLAEALAPDHADAPPAPALSLQQDAVRMAAEGHQARITARLASGSGRDRGAMERAMRAWGYGSAQALSVLEEEWTPGAEALARARDQLAASWEDEEQPRLRATRNRWTAVGTDAQLRLGRDGRWWPYRKERGNWCPAGPAEHDPAAALAVLLPPS